VNTSGFLLDTNVVSEALRPRPDTRVLAWLRANEARECLSVVAIGEIEAGILGAPDPSRAESLRVWLDEVRIPRFTHRLLPLDLATARCWGELTAAARATGTPVGGVDA